jgi:hypothetical protein
MAWLKIEKHPEIIAWEATMAAKIAMTKENQNA